VAKGLILIVDDEEDILELVRYNLEKEGYKVISALSGETAIQLARSEAPDLMVLDLMLPGIDGLDVCRILKNDPKTNSISIIMLSAKGEEADVVSGLELGADDYISKPFSPRVLLARVKSALRKSKTTAQVAPESSLRIEGLVIDPKRHEVSIDNALIELTHTEFKLLHFLALQPGYVFTRDQIVNAIHGHDYPVTDRSIDVQVVGLRKKLLEYEKYIETVRGVGYRFKETS
jgi:two-component system, OmpR family, alkaline phosphatase synthesis response regulator PhoP